jgi:hypothetical protein
MSLAVLTGVGAGAGSAVAATRRVPEDYARITTAVHNAAVGDTVLIGPGTYRERFVARRNMVIRGAGIANTTIDGSVSLGNVVTIAGTTEDFVLEDLSITGSRLNTAHPESTGAAIYVNEGSPIIQRVRMTGNFSNSGVLSAYFFARPIVRDCWIVDNSGGGIFLEHDVGEAGAPYSDVSNTLIAGNTGYGISVIDGARARITNCTIAYNLGDGLRSRDQTRVELSRSILAFNGGAGVIRYTTNVCFFLVCNDVYQNTDGQWIGTNPGDPCFPGRGVGDVQIDPLFCNAAADDYRLSTASPLHTFCLSGCGGGIGVDPDCVGVPNCTTNVESSTWSVIKRRYRGR